MKRLPLILLLVTVYLNQLLLLHALQTMTGDGEGPYPVAIVVSSAAAFVLAAVNVVVAIVGVFRRGESGAGVALCRVMLCKLALVPFFCLHAIWCLLLFAGLANPWLMWFIPALPFLFLSFAYAVLLATSAHAIAEVIRLVKSKSMTAGACVLHVILQLLFVTDVIGSVCLFVKYRKR